MPITRMFLNVLMSYKKLFTINRYYYKENNYKYNIYYKALYALKFHKLFNLQYI